MSFNACIGGGSVSIGSMKHRNISLRWVFTFRNGIRDDVAEKELLIVALHVRTSQLLPSTPLPITTMEPMKMGAHFLDLPVEIHEMVLDHLFGERTAVCFNLGGPSALRHPRRKALTSLALVCQRWTSLVQGRIYRHIKVKATMAGLDDCARWFMNHLHLIEHVRHVEMWVPVWGGRAAGNPEPHEPREEVEQLTEVGVVILPDGLRYHRAGTNATLDEIFEVVQKFFTSARIFTLEGGDGLKAPLVSMWRGHPIDEWTKLTKRNSLPVLDHIESFEMRGAWNLMRNYEDWFYISRALPNLSEWHCSYAQIQTGGYTTLGSILSMELKTLRHLNLSLEAFTHNLDSVHNTVPKPVVLPICHVLGKSALNLETLSFTGRVCSHIFRAMSFEAMGLSSHSRLKSMNLTVKSCCRNEWPSTSFLPVSHELAGTHLTEFNDAFHAMVVQAVHALAVLPNLQHLRIRFLDFDAECPLLNPYFEINGDTCIGLWSDSILAALKESRPNASFIQLAHGIQPHIKNGQITGAVPATYRPLGIQAKRYLIISEHRIP